ncbi:hypothetical protein ACFPOI_30950 [Nonomuraea angiospora]|uniref:Uncharacterized protein n=1 Tax=Nonomuraea angiospora TaxID=46172 RepID=A0ABR9LV21_9ACTN|nr:hypothetical protein [Nonomuraea angiospora]MBE1584497.1 hypothetical protein [Nonomuraea angiospora]
MSHEVSGQTARSAELTYDPGYHALLERLRPHGRQPTASSALDVKPDELLTIGELARTTGVATSALRYRNRRQCSGLQAGGEADQPA